MNASITTIKEPDGDILYPKTKTEAVYDDSNNRLDQTLTSIQGDLGSKSSASAVTGNDAFSKISTLNSQLMSVSDKFYSEKLPVGWSSKSVDVATNHVYLVSYTGVYTNNDRALCVVFIGSHSQTIKDIDTVGVGVYATASTISLSYQSQNYDGGNLGIVQIA